LRRAEAGTESVYESLNKESVRTKDNNNQPDIMITKDFKTNTKPVYVGLVREAGNMRE